MKKLLFIFLFLFPLTLNAQQSVKSITFKDLPIPASTYDGQVFWCKDCTAVSVCTGSGTGAWALSLGGVYNCTKAGSSGGGGGGGAPVSLQDLGSAFNPTSIACDFANFRYCLSSQTFSQHTPFTPASNPPTNAWVHFAYRGTGGVASSPNFMDWPANFKQSGGGGVSGGSSLIAWAPINGIGPFDVDFFYDGTNYITGNVGVQTINVVTANALLSNTANIDTYDFGGGLKVHGNSAISCVVGFGPSGGTCVAGISGDTTQVVTATANITLSVSAVQGGITYSGWFDAQQDATGGRVITLAAKAGQTMVWETANGAVPVLDTRPNADNWFFVLGDKQGTNNFFIYPMNPEQNPSTSAFGSLPATCQAGQQLYCSDCKNVADAITMASTCVGSGTGSQAICKGSNTWKCGS